MTRKKPTWNDTLDQVETLAPDLIGKQVEVVAGSWTGLTGVVFRVAPRSRGGFVVHLTQCSDKRTTPFVTEAINVREAKQ